MSIKKNVLYFTVVPLETLNNGGSLCGITNIINLSNDSKINLIVATAGDKSREQSVKTQLNAFGVKNYFVPYVKSEKSLESNKVIRVIKKLRNEPLSSLFNFDFEETAAAQLHVSEFLANLCQELLIDVVIIEYLFSILFFKNFLSIPQKKVYVSLNREAEMFLDRVRLTPASKINRTRKLIAHSRLKRFEKEIQLNVDKNVFISKTDIPSYLAGSKRAGVITPLLEFKKDGWKYAASFKILFVGGVGHYPNRLAVEWLLKRFALKLMSLNDKIEIVIIGVAADEFASHSIPNNIKFLGFATEEELELMFKTADMFICPVKNNHGVKFKLLSCISYGMPFIATEGCLEGLPFLSEMPLLDLNKSDEAAKFVDFAVSNPQFLNDLSEKILSQSKAFAEQQKDVWGNTVLDT